MQRLRALSEGECYLRCYGQRAREETVRVLPPAAPTAGERRRAAPERRLDAREREPR